MLACVSASTVVAALSLAQENGDAPLTEFSPQRRISAAEVNGNFAELERRIAALRETAATPFEPRVCGVTQRSFDGRVENDAGQVGDPAAGMLCQQACDSRTAHMCTTHEVAISRQRGVGLPEGVGAARVSSGADAHDCFGWINNEPARTTGHLLDNVLGVVEQQNCSERRPLLCCDLVPAR